MSVTPTVHTHTYTHTHTHKMYPFAVLEETSNPSAPRVREEKPLRASSRKQTPSALDPASSAERYVTQDGLINIYSRRLVLTATAVTELLARVLKRASVWPPLPCESISVLMKWLSAFSVIISEERRGESLAAPLVIFICKYDGCHYTEIAFPIDRLYLCVWVWVCVGVRELL